MEQGWVVEGFSIGIPSGYHYRVTRTDDPLTFAKIPAEERAVTAPQEPDDVVGLLERSKECACGRMCPHDYFILEFKRLLAERAALTHAIEAMREELETLKAMKTEI